MPDDAGLSLETTMRALLLAALKNLDLDSQMEVLVKAGVGNTEIAKMRTPVVDWSGNYEETCLQLAKHLGKSKIRRKLFDAIYGRVSKPRTRKQMVTATNLKSSDGQQVQNELDHLARCGLIERIKNEGNVAVNDGSRWLYRKDENVRAHRAQILKFANNPEAAEKVPTKRRPRGMATVLRSALKKRRHLDVLYLTANPHGDLRVGAEVTRVQQEVRGSKLRDNIDVHYRPAASLDSDPRIE